MSEKDAATREGAGEGEDGKVLSHTDRAALNEAFMRQRSDPMEEIAARQAEARNKELGVEPKTAEAEQGQTPSDELMLESLKPADQLKKQVEDEEIVLTPEMLARAKIVTKVDGSEEAVPAAKIVASYQKGAAADVRLAKAVEAEKAAQAKLAEAEKKLAEASSAADSKRAEADVKAAGDAYEKARKGYMSALYEGDENKASELFDEAVKAAVRSALPERSQPATPAVSAEEIVQQTTARVKQQLNVDSALKKLFEDYPEIQKDADFTFLADKEVARRVAEGTDMALAITEAGETLGQKFGLGKHAKVAEPKDEGRPKSNGGTTTRAEKLEKKEAIDNPSIAGGRSSTTEPRPETASDVIARMAEARGAGRPL